MHLVISFMLVYYTELEKTVNRLFETLAVRMNNSKCLSKAFSKESKRISADINDLASNFFNIVFITNILNTGNYKLLNLLLINCTDINNVYWNI